MSVVLEHMDRMIRSTLFMLSGRVIQVHVDKHGFLLLYRETELQLPDRVQNKPVFYWPVS